MKTLSLSHTCCCVRLQGVFVVKIALSSCSWPQPPNFSQIRRKKIAARKSAEKNAASRKSAEKVRQLAEYKKKMRLGGLLVIIGCLQQYIEMFQKLLIDILPSDVPKLYISVQMNHRFLFRS